MNYSIPKEVLQAHSRTHPFPLEINDEIVFVKKRRPTKLPLGRLAQYILYCLTGSPLIIPTPWTSENNVVVETARLHRLAELGIRVPRVLHVEKDYFVMSSVGETMKNVLKKMPDRAREYCERAVAELRDFHTLGGAQIKNLTLLDDVMHFIDFESKIPEKDLEKFQLRDLFLMLLSLEGGGQNLNLEKLCGIYDATGRSLTRVCDALLGIRRVRLLDYPILRMASTKDTRNLTALIRKAERVASGK